MAAPGVKRGARCGTDSGVEGSGAAPSGATTAAAGGCSGGEAIVVESRVSNGAEPVGKDVAACLSRLAGARRLAATDTSAALPDRA